METIQTVLINGRQTAIKPMLNYRQIQRRCKDINLIDGICLLNYWHPPHLQVKQLAYL